MAKTNKLFTIGYEQTPPKAVLDELEAAGVKLLVDVRAVAVLAPARLFQEPARGRARRARHRLSASARNSARRRSGRDAARSGKFDAAAENLFRASEDAAGEGRARRTVVTGEVKPEVKTGNLSGTRFCAMSSELQWSPLPPMMVDASGEITVYSVYRARDEAGWRLIDEFGADPHLRIHRSVQHPIPDRHAPHGLQDGDAGMVSRRRLRERQFRPRVASTGASALCFESDVSISFG